MRMEEQKDPKAWLGQWLAMMFGGALIACVFIQMITGTEIPLWFIGVASGFIGVQRVGREVEKRKAK